MFEILILAVLLLGLGAIVYYWRSAHARQRARERMEHAAEVSQGLPPAPLPKAQSYLVRYRFVPWVLALIVAALLHYAFGWALPFVFAISLVVGLLVDRLECYLAERRTAKIETQLADAIDLMWPRCGPGPESPMPWRTPCAKRAALCFPSLKRWWAEFVMETIRARFIAG